MDHPMPSGLGTITLPTIDHGDVTLPEPSWCVGHETDAGHQRVDLQHLGPDVALDFQGKRLMTSGLVQAPFGADTTPGISVFDIGVLDARLVYQLAADLDAYADRLRSLADQLLVILAGEDQ
ncbi:DUF6907 domain-containing protein [Streptomyces sp. ME01-18h]|uniref:DUF6907 domain-containing protein n=1 Tax=Streptomyces sp. ME01-18h TaxID=462920 RepID=UPI0029B6404E|nr:hypothetical protein [Streptomyces sp. ME01-18h]MDX3400077.1 hypothetical protein [Streptomyces sp. ME01-18h]